LECSIAWSNSKKRVAELEAKSNPAEAKAAETAAAQPTPAQPSSANAPSAAPVAANCGESGGGRRRDEIAGAGKRRAAAKGRSPFAFADFTWLNGNARTKELRHGHEIFHAGNQSRHRLHLRERPRSTSIVCLL